MKTESRLAENKYNLIVAAENACARFDHFDECLHMTEIDNGTSKALFMNLAQEMISDENVSDNYVELLLSALEMVHRCPSKFVRLSVKSVGTDRLFHLLCEIIEKYVQYPAYCQAHASSIVQKVAKLFLHFAKVDGIKHRMAGCYEVVLSMVVVLKSGTMECSTKAEAVNLLAELAYTEDCDGVAIHVDGLVDALIECGESSDAIIREGSARAFLNLSTAMESRQILGWKDDTISVLLSYLDEVNSDDTRKCAIGALGNISACDENKLRLVNYRGGLLVEVLLILMYPRAIKNLRKDAIGVLRNLCSVDTSHILCNRPDFLMALASEAACDGDMKIRGDSLKVLRRLSVFVNATSPCYPYLVSALFNALGGAAKTRKQIVAIFREQATMLVNRPVLAQFPGLLDALGVISLDFEDSKCNAIRAILYISYLDESGITFEASEIVMTALTEAANLTKKKDTLVRFEAIKAIRQLAGNEVNRKLMLCNTSLLVALKWTVEKTAKIVTITDTLTELFASNPANPVDIVESFLDVIDGPEDPLDKTTNIRDEDLASLAGLALARIIGRA